MPSPNGWPRRVSLLENKWSFYALMFVWLLFIPNSFLYYHWPVSPHILIQRPSGMMCWWSFLLPGTGYYMESFPSGKWSCWFQCKSGKTVSVFFILLVMWLAAFGIYIGRFLRYNSWDIITNPFRWRVKLWIWWYIPFKHGYGWGNDFWLWIVYDFCFIWRSERLGRLLNFLTQKETKMKPVEKKLACKLFYFACSVQMTLAWFLNLQ